MAADIGQQTDNKGRDTDSSPREKLAWVLRASLEGGQQSLSPEAVGKLADPLRSWENGQRDPDRFLS